MRLFGMRVSGKIFPEMGLVMDNFALKTRVLQVRRQIRHLGRVKEPPGAHKLLIISHLPDWNLGILPQVIFFKK